MNAHSHIHTTISALFFNVIYLLHYQTFVTEPVFLLIHETCYKCTSLNTVSHTQTLPVTLSATTQC